MPRSTAPSLFRRWAWWAWRRNLPDIGGLLKINWTGLGLQSITSSDYRDPGFLNWLQEYQDHVSWFKGRHNIKFGVQSDARRMG